MARAPADPVTAETATTEPPADADRRSRVAPGVLVVIGVFVVVRFAYWATGGRFSTAALSTSWQLLDLHRLTADPFGSVALLHIQPPAFNLFVGVVERWSPTLGRVHVPGALPRVRPDPAPRAAGAARGARLLRARGHGRHRRRGRWIRCCSATRTPSPTSCRSRRSWSSPDGAAPGTPGRVPPRTLVGFVAAMTAGGAHPRAAAPGVVGRDDRARGRRGPASHRLACDRCRRGHPARARRRLDREEPGALRRADDEQHSRRQPRTRGHRPDATRRGGGPDPRRFDHTGGARARVLLLRPRTNRRSGRAARTGPRPSYGRW